MLLSCLRRALVTIYKYLLMQALVANILVNLDPNVTFHKYLLMQAMSDSFSSLRAK